MHSFAPTPLPPEFWQRNGGKGIRGAAGIDCREVARDAQIHFPLIVGHEADDVVVEQGRPG